MAIKTIFAPILGREEDTVVLRSALAMARMQNAHVFVAHVGRDPRTVMAGQMGEGMTAAMVDAMLDSAEQQLAAAQAGARAVFDDWIRVNAIAVTKAPQGGGTVTASFEPLVGDPGRLVARRGRLCSVTVVARTDGDATAEARAVLEAAIMDTGRAVLYVPDDRPPKTIAAIGVAWNGSREAARALALSLPILEQAPAVHVIAAVGEQVAVEDVESCVQALRWHGAKAEARTFVDLGAGQGAGWPGGRADGVRARGSGAGARLARRGCGERERERGRGRGRGRE